MSVDFGLFIVSDPWKGGLGLPNTFCKNSKGPFDDVVSFSTIARIKDLDGFVLTLM